MNISLNDYVVLNAQGAVDQDGMLGKLSAVVAKFAAERDGTNTKLEQELDKIFDESDKKSIKTELLALKLVTLRGGDFEKDLQAAKKELKAFVESHPRFGTGAGRSGGVSRLSLRDAENAREHGIEAPESTDEVEVEVSAADSAAAE